VRRGPLLATTTFLAALAGCRASAPPETATPGVAFGTRMQAAARALEPEVRSGWVRAFVRAASDLPRGPRRTLYRNDSGTRTYSEEQAAALPAEARARLWSRTHEDETYWVLPSAGTPLDYTRALDVLAAAGLASPSGKRILDFGCGGLGHLRMLAGLGADVVGVDVEPVLLPLYGAGQGEVRGAGDRPGRVTLVSGRFPADPEVRAKVGGPFDAIVSKNVLKRGYIHPSEPVPPQQRVELGLPDDAFVRALHDALVPGGLLLLYNVYPPQGTPYRPWADGRSPFDRETWERAGFVVRAIDVDDSAAARRMGHAVGWDREPGVDLARDYFAMYTLLERPLAPP